MKEKHLTATVIELFKNLLTEYQHPSVMKNILEKASFEVDIEQHLTKILESEQISIDLACLLYHYCELELRKKHKKYMKIKKVESIIYHIVKLGYKIP